MTALVYFLGKVIYSQDAMHVDTAPYYEVSAADVAAWLTENAADASWTVDGDNLLMSRLDFPCPSDELASELERLGGELLVRAPDGHQGNGQRIDSGTLSQVVQRAPVSQDEGAATARFFQFRWKGDDTSDEWVLFEDVA